MSTALIGVGGQGRTAGKRERTLPARLPATRLVRGDARPPSVTVWFSYSFDSVAVSARNEFDAHGGAIRAGGLCGEP